MNIFGVDVAELDVPGFLASARHLFVAAALLWLALGVRLRRPRFLLAGVALANAWVWFVTNYPLQSLYGLLTSGDRVGNLALVQVVAAGNPPHHTAQAGQLHFEPFWGLLVAALSGFDPERVLAVYPYLPLVMVVGFAVALYWATAAAPAATAWERVLVAGFATLLSSAPLEFTGTYRGPWAMTFLLKPNHALGLVLAPIVLRAFTAIRGWRGRVAVGLLLHVLAWVFVIHMVFVAAGLVVFAALSWLSRRREAGRDTLDAVVVIGVNVLIVSPYLYMLFTGYPFLYASPRAMIPPFSAHLFEATLKQGPLFFVSIAGIVVAWRRGDRFSRLFVAQTLAAHLIWLGYLVLSMLQLARERDEIYYWVRFLTAASAAVGAWGIAGRLSRAGVPLLLRPSVRAAALGVLALPWSLPYWWDPARTDSYFTGSLAPLPERLRLPTDFIRRNTPAQAVFAGDGDYARYVAALGGRRVSLAMNFHIPPRYRERVKLEEDLVLESDPAASLPVARALGISYLVVSARMLAAYPSGAVRFHEPRRVGLDEIDSRSHLQRVFLWRDGSGDYVAVYRIAGASS
jgi:hypothetical protein